MKVIFRYNPSDVSELFHIICFCSKKKRKKWQIIYVSFVVLHLQFKLSFCLLVSRSVYLESDWLRPLRKLLRASKDTSWLGFTKLVMTATEPPYSESAAWLMLPEVWQVMKPEIWKSLKFLRNMWTLVYFSAYAGGWTAARRPLCPSLCKKMWILRRTKEVKDGLVEGEKSECEWVIERV